MLRQRVITALVLAPLVFLVILWIPHPVTAAVLALLVAAGAWEWSAFPGFTRQSARLGYVAFIAGCVIAAWYVGVNSVESNLLLYASLVWWVLALLWIAFAPGNVNRATAAIAGLFVLVPVWLALVRLHAQAPQLLLFLLLLVVAADIGAYFAGRAFGKHKLAPRVSPGKTWEGVGGGMLASALMAAVGVWWFKMDTVPFMALCVVVAIASVVGDLTESLFKRHAGLKDSGSLLPGHGGVLDRVDSVTAAAPVFLIGLERLGLLR
ncbi:phosphatidate cytidylyltransferase [Steroidobacter sp. S1-65]|uniref:Phosphatidate cytidylyltransferase n=1 Tax=Steroidobacter gossypii TaxID=2805490 RepID=A0ABS1WVT8_9GAMM|nr:phosphatidate cytidylyltransferase [Steroidobacter gossypii]MBM0105068.1 phosphatidate cytidylyltransferase [Steroidobacter gossypii]